MGNQIIDTEFYCSPSEFKICKPMKKDELNILENKLELLIEKNKEDLQQQIDNLSKLKTFKFMQKVSDYLYEIDYNLVEYSYDYAREYFKTHKITPAGCSQVVNGNFIGRNFDWFYNEDVEFIVRTYAKEGRHAVTGIAAGVPGLTKDFVKLNYFDKKYWILPFFLTDGFNDAGLYCGINVVPADKGNNLKSIPLISEKEEIAMPMLPRFVLDNFEDPEEACKYIRDFVSITNVDSLIEKNYEAHLLIANSNNSFVLEIIDGKVKYFKSNALTNFHLYDVIFNEDGKVYTPATQDAKHNAIKTNKISKHGSGLERWNIIKSNYNLTSTKDGMSYLMHYLLNYNNTYSKTLEPRWYTEFTGLYDSKTYSADLTVKTNPAEFDSYIVPLVQSWFVNRTREDGKLWHTTHTVVYDLTAKKLYVYDSTENSVEHAFNFNHYYTAAEIDAIMAELPTKEDYIEVKEAVDDVIARTDYFEEKFDIIDTEVATIDNKVDNKLVILEDAIAVEVERATNEEASLNAKIETITEDLQNQINDVNSALSLETVSRTEADNEIESQLSSEISRSTEVDETLRNELNIEIERATEIELQLDEKIDTKQEKLTAGTNITIDENNVISAADGGATNLENGSGVKTLVQKESTSFTLNGNTYDVDATGKAAVVLNGKSAATGSRAFASGSSTVASGDYSHTEGVNTLASGNQSHAEGNGTKAINASTHAEGILTEASSEGAHAEGNATTASGGSAHAEGTATVASAGSAHAEGTSTTASKQNAHAEGLSTIANGIAAHAEGKETSVTNDYAHAEGNNTTASGACSHAEGLRTKAQGEESHAGGVDTTAHGKGATAIGHGTTAYYDYQLGIGEYNKNNQNTLFEVGNGISGSRNNAFEVYRDGTVVIPTGAKGIKIGNTVLTEQQLIKLLALLDTMEAE